MAQLRDERSLGDLFSDLSRETTTLVRQEVQLAKAELTQSATEAARGIGMLVAGGAVAYAGLLFLLLAIVFGLIEAGLGRLGLGPRRRPGGRGHRRRPGAARSRVPQTGQSRTAEDGRNTEGGRSMGERADYVSTSHVRADSGSSGASGSGSDSDPDAIAADIEPPARR